MWTINRQSQHPRGGRRTTRVLGFALLAFIASGAAPAAADISPIYIHHSHNLPRPEEPECDTAGEWGQVGQPASAPEITHATRYELFSGGTTTHTWTAGHRNTITAGLSVTTEVEFNHNLIFEKFDAKVSATIQGEYEHTKTEDISIATTLKQNDVYIFFGGTQQYTAPYTVYKCQGGETVSNSGEVHSWDIDTEGVVGCSQDVPTASMAYKAKAQYCMEGDATAYANLLLSMTPTVQVQHSAAI